MTAVLSLDGRHPQHRNRSLFRCCRGNAGSELQARAAVETLGLFVVWLEPVQATEYVPSRALSGRVRLVVASQAHNSYETFHSLS